MKSIYNTPEIEITLFTTEEILLTSGTGIYELDEKTGLTADDVFGS
ncbi:MAG: hypothetical protein IJ062_12950 [Firmicutes bacterium]|nr:hypothetical protein [Bacillota bacterium]